jgi:LysR family glycine cleavage system transcriptional activator
MPPHRLPPMNALRAFEAVARRGSILQAAAELGVVRGAVRQQIAALEAHFGVALFRRDGRGLVLTEKGRGYAEAVAPAFVLLARASAELEGGRHGRLALGVPSVLAMWWLMPRLAALQAALPQVEIDIMPLTVIEALSGHPELDAVIMGGEYRPSPEIVATPFMADEFGPVAAPGLAARLADGPAGLAGAVGLASRSAPTLWDDWFAESGVPPVRFARQQAFEDLLLAIGAARSGLGVAVVPRIAVEDDIARGALVAPWGFIARPGGYALCRRKSDVASRPLAALAEWLVAAGA